MNIELKSESLSKTIDIGERVDELELQFCFLKGVVNELLDDFIKDTDQSLRAIRRIDFQSDELKKEVSGARKRLKSAAILFEEKLDNTLHRWRSEIKDDLKHLNKYDQNFF